MNVTVVSAEKIKDKDNGFSVYKVTAKQDDGTQVEAERFGKFPPKAGDKGTIEQSQYGPKFKPAGGGFGGGGRRVDPAAEAARQASIIHQHSQTVGLELLKATGQLRLDTRPEDVDAAVELLGRVAAKLTAQVVAVGKKAEAAKK